MKQCPGPSFQWPIVVPKRDRGRLNPDHKHVVDRCGGVPPRWGRNAFGKDYRRPDQADSIHESGKPCVIEYGACGFSSQPENFKSIKRDESWHSAVRGRQSVPDPRVVLFKARAIRALENTMAWLVEIFYGNVRLLAAIT